MSVTADTLAALQEQLRELEIDAVLIRGRIEQLRSTIGWLEAMPRRGRPANISALNPVPPQTAISMANPEPEPETAA